jgi:hypothetical protein
MTYIVEQKYKTRLLDIAIMLGNKCKYILNGEVVKSLYNIKHADIDNIYLLNKMTSNAIYDCDLACYITLKNAKISGNIRFTEKKACIWNKINKSVVEDINVYVEQPEHSKLLFCSDMFINDMYNIKELLYKYRNCYIIFKIHDSENMLSTIINKKGPFHTPSIESSMLCISLDTIQKDIKEQRLDKLKTINIL